MKNKRQVNLIIQMETLKLVRLGLQSETYVKEHFKLNTEADSTLQTDASVYLLPKLSP